MPKHPHSRSVLLARQMPGQSSADVTASLTELSRLVEGLGIRVVHTVVQKRPAATGVLGKGKLQEVAALLAELAARPDADAVLVVFDGELDPGQLRLLQNELEVEVVDRTDIILRVFASRARTRTAQLEVELARLKYQAPRVRDDESWPTGRAAAAGAVNAATPTCRLRKQRIRERVAAIERELESAAPDAGAAAPAPPRAAVGGAGGYTNAGKSSLMRGLTGSECWWRTSCSPPWAPPCAPWRRPPPRDPGHRHGRLHQEPAPRADHQLPLHPGRGPRRRVCFSTWWMRPIPTGASSWPSPGQPSRPSATATRPR